MLTPQEVANKSFTKSMMGGYSMPMVDEFLDELTEDYSALYKENAALKAKMKVLVEKVEEYRATEESMRTALFSAQKMATSIVEEAKAKSSNIVSSAEAEARTEIARIRAGIEEEEKRLAAAKAQTADFVSQWQAICQKQETFLQALPTLPVAPAAQTETASAETQSPIEESILNAIRSEAEKASAPEETESAPAQTESAPVFAPRKAAQTESAAPEEVPSAEDVSGLFETRTFRLEDLQFGRNYGGDSDKG